MPCEFVLTHYIHKRFLFFALINSLGTMFAIRRVNSTELSAITMTEPVDIHPSDNLIIDVHQATQAAVDTVPRPGRLNVQLAEQFARPAASR